MEIANNGTLFLDEIGDISPIVQPKILRFIQSGEFRRVGGNTTLNADVRILSATNKNLKDEVREGRFREDLLYRLNVITIEIPPLRQRKAGHPAAGRLLPREPDEDPGEDDDLPEGDGDPDRNTTGRATSANSRTSSSARRSSAGTA